MTGLSMAELAAAIEAIRKLILIGAIDPTIASLLGASGGTTASTIPELGKPQIVEMSGRYSGGGQLPPGKEALRPGKSELAEYDIDRYGTFSNRPQDKLAGHELLQNLWLRVKGFVTTRGVGAASRNNPAVALSKPVHDAVGREQIKLGLFNEAKVAKMTAAENIELNAQAMRNAGVPAHIVEVLKGDALRHAATLQAAVAVP